MCSPWECYLPPADCWSCRRRSPRVACCPTPRPQAGRRSRRNPRNKIKHHPGPAQQLCLSVCLGVRTCLIFFAVMMWLVLYVSIPWASVGRNKAEGRSQVVADTQDSHTDTPSCPLTEQTEVVALRQPRHAVAPLVEEVEKLQRFAHHDLSHHTHSSQHNNSDESPGGALKRTAAARLPLLSNPAPSLIGGCRWRNKVTVLSDRAVQPR